MFNRHKNDKSEITLTLDRPDGWYFPGEPVSITIDITAHQALKVRSAAVRLRCIELFQYRQMDTDTNAGGRIGTAYGNNEVLCRERLIIADPTTILPDTPQHFVVEMVLPEEALPSVGGDVLRVSWQADVKVDIPRAKDLHAEAILQVRRRPVEVQAAPGEYGKSDVPDTVDMSFTLPGVEACGGDTISGELCVLPHKDFEAKVRLALTCSENIFRDEGDQHKRGVEVVLAGPTQFTAGQAQRFPFQVTVPADLPPSIQTPNGSIDWYLRAALDRQAHLDTTIRQSLVIYPAR